MGRGRGSAHLPKPTERLPLKLGFQTTVDFAAKSHPQRDQAPSNVNSCASAHAYNPPERANSTAGKNSRLDRYLGQPHSNRRWITKQWQVNRSRHQWDCRRMNRPRCTSHRLRKLGRFKLTFSRLAVSRRQMGQATCRGDTLTPHAQRSPISRSTRRKRSLTSSPA